MDCPGDSEEEEDCGEECQCVLNRESYIEQFGEAPPAGPVGYIEVDGDDGNTAGDTPVNIGDTMDDDVTFHVGKCNNW